LQRLLVLSIAVFITSTMRYWFAAGQLKRTCNVRLLVTA